jgi:hypothetical protein
MGSLARPRSLAGWTVVAAAGLGLGLRVYASAGIWPADLSKHDTAAYVRAAHYGLGKDPLEPTGYSIFLRVLHFVWAQLAFTVAVQHLLGLAAGALLYLAVRRLGASPWIALAGAAAIWLNGDQILLEQTLLSEGLFVFVLMAAVYSLVRSRDSGGYLWPALTAGLTVALPFIRGVADPLLIVLGGFLLFGLWRARGRWLLRAAVALAAAVVVVAGYSGIRHHDTGSWSVSVKGGGWSLYARVAQWADCSRFKPPSGTRPLCESTPASQRPGAGVYSWLPQSPAIKAYGEPPRGSRQVGEFALAAIEHQPGDYAHAVLVDMARYVNPGAGSPKAGDFGGPDSLSFANTRSPDGEGTQQVRAYYDGFRIRTGAAGSLADYQSVMRVHGWLLAVLAALGLAGVLLARGPLRYGALLMGLSGLALPAIPALVNTTTWRYSIPAAPLLMAAGAIGVAALWPLLASALGRVSAPRRTAPTQ